MTRRLTTRERLAQIAERRVAISEFIGRALAEDLDLVAEANELLDLLNGQDDAEQPGRMV